MGDSRRNRASRIGDRVSCFVCERSEPIQTAEDHHRTPRAFGGTDDASNRVWLCPSCHARLHRVQTYLTSGKIQSAYRLCCEIFPTDGGSRGRLWELSNEASKSEIEVKDSFYGQSQYQKVSIRVDSDVWRIIRSEAKSRNVSASKLAAEILKRHVIGK